MSFADKIFSVVFKPIWARLENIEKRIKNIEENQNNLSNKLETLLNRCEILSENVRNNSNVLEGYESLCENVRNINSVLEGYESLCENVRNNNKVLEGYESLCENVRNNNKVLEGYESLCENVRNNNKVLEGYKSLCENVRNNNKILEGYEGLCENVRNLNALHTEINALHFAVNKIKRESKSVIRPEPQIAEAEKPVSESSLNTYYEIDYEDFENYFRGTRDNIKKTQLQYLPYFMDCSNVVDIGCGRGEFLELLRENGIKASGADTYNDFVEYCRSLELDVHHADGIEYLKKCEKVDGIFVGQVVEHMSVGQIMELAETAYDKLEEGSYIIAETPNPRSLSIYCNAFYLDPSHNKPVHPETLRYLFRNAGFENIEILYTENSKPDVTIPPLNGEDEFNRSINIIKEMLFGSQDYALIARK